MKSAPAKPDENRQPAAFVDNYLLYQLAATSHLYSAEFHSCVKSHGVKIPVWRVLGCLIDQPGLMLTELAKRVLYEQSRLTKIIDQMASDGLVTKKTVATDRRKTAISITPKACCPNASFILILTSLRSARNTEASLKHTLPTWLPVAALA